MKRYIQKYHNYGGGHLHRYPNLLNRNFQAARPNQKWFTDISYIKTGEGFLFLSIIRDLFDNSIIAHKTGSEQNVNLVLNTIKEARKKKWSPKSCNYKVTKAFNTHPKHISAGQNLMALTPSMYS